MPHSQRQDTGKGPSHGGDDGHQQPYTGEDRRATRAISEHEIKLLAREAAQMVIAELFEIFGADISTPDGRKGLQDDFAWLREARKGTASLRNAGWLTAWGAVVTAACLALWKGLVVLAGGVPK